MTFHDIQFPLALSLGAKGGPVRRTQISTLGSGHEQRNTPWAGSLRRFDAGLGVTSLEAVEELIAFFEARQGPLHAFRFRDPFDWKSCPLTQELAAEDQLVGTGDGQEMQFQLIKQYTSGNESYTRRITKPVPNSIQIAIDGQLKEEGVDYTVEPLTGLIIFAAPPASNDNITAGFEFDVPVRFASDALELSFATIKAGRIPHVPLQEVREG